MIVVTGAAGFIGSNIVADREEEQIIAVDWFGNGDKWRNLAKRSNVRGVVSPENLLDYLEESRHKITAVIHMGAISSTVETNVDKLLEWNTAYTVNLWGSCNRYRIPFIYASSAAVYGLSKSFEEDQELLPLNPYGWSKKLADEAIVFDGKSQCVGLRFFNVYGSNEYHKGAQASMICQAYDKNYVNLFKGDPQRDFIYVKDCCKIIRAFLSNPSISGIFNVGTEIARRFDDIVSILGKEINLIDAPSQYQNYTKADMSKARITGIWFKPTSLEDGIRDYVDNYLSKEDRYR